MGLINAILFRDRAPQVLQKALDLNAQKAATAAGNISNAETPGYKAKRFEFESVLQQAVGGSQLPMTVTNGKHLMRGNQDFSSISGVTDIDLSQGRIDGNNVDMDREMAGFSEAQIAYDAAVTALTKRAATIRSAVTDVK
ncbi:MAG: flagellar basal body rod protein FlgB [Nitrospinae bacterium]|nr:flagellar basal body rod protein FlgB [Nitrospinota bacterium]